MEKQKSGFGATLGAGPRGRNATLAYGGLTAGLTGFLMISDGPGGVKALGVLVSLLGFGLAAWGGDRHLKVARGRATLESLRALLRIDEQPEALIVGTSYSSEGLRIEHPAFGAPVLLASASRWLLVDPRQPRAAATRPWGDVAKVGQYKLTMTDGSWLKIVPASGEDKQSDTRLLSALHAGAGLLERYGPVVPQQRPVQYQVRYLGGFGSPLIPGADALVVVGPAGVRVVHGSQRFEASHRELEGYQLGGVGQYETGGGWIGGGFGVAGALQGAAFALVMNALTTRIRNDCLLRFVFANAEMTFEVLVETPAQVELELSALTAALRQRAGTVSQSVMHLTGGVSVANPAAFAQVASQQASTSRVGQASGDEAQRFCTSCGQARATRHAFCGCCGAAQDAS